MCNYLVKVQDEWIVEHFYEEAVTRGAIKHRDIKNRDLTLYPVYDALGDEEGFQYFAMICIERPPAIDSYWNDKEPPKHVGNLLLFDIGDSHSL
jgi:hypothetical protein